MLNGELKKQPDMQKITPYSIIVILLCALSFAATFIARNVWSSAIASKSTLEILGITALQAGGIASAFYVGSVISNFFSGWVIDLFGAKKILAITSLGTGIATLLIPFASGYWMIFMLRVLAGLLAGPIFTAVTKCNYGYFSDRFRAGALGFMSAGASVGMALSSIIFTPMIASQGYKIAFVWAGAVTLIVGVIVWLVLKDQGAMLPLKNMEEVSEEDKKNSTKNALKVFMRKDFLIGTLTHFTFMCYSAGLITWVLAYLIIGKGIAPATAGLVFGGAQMIGLIANAFGGVISDFLKTRKWTMIAFATIAGCGLLVFKQLNSISAMTVCISVIYLCGNMAGISSNTMQLERAKGPYAGKVIGWYSTLTGLGMITMPLITGAVLDATRSYSAVLIAISCAYFLVVFLGFLVKDTYKREPKQN